MKAFPDLQKTAIKVIGLNWAGWLPEGVTLASVTVTVNTSGVTLASAAVSGDLTTVKITAGNIGDYLITFKPILSDGEIEPRTAKQRVVEYKSA